LLLFYKQFQIFSTDFFWYINFYANIYILIDTDIIVKKKIKKSSVKMIKKTSKIWIWIQNNRLLKAVSNQNTGTLTIYDEYDKILLRRTGLSIQQIKNLELIFSNNCIKRIGDHKGPFSYL